MESAEGDSGNVGAKSILGLSPQGPDPPFSLTQQENTGSTPTRAVLGMPSWFSATLQQEVKPV